MHTVPSVHCLAGARTRRTRLAAVVVAAALGMPGAAYPFSLNVLLHMPLERLLQLKITPRRVALADAPAPLQLAGQIAHGRPHARA
ncbi:MAG: hypothetical protein OEY03_12750 [Rhizobacter sp.]|nr:hypothetical protein [Rhizobacter sp.]